MRELTSRKNVVARSVILWCFPCSIPSGSIYASSFRRRGVDAQLILVGVDKCSDEAFWQKTLCKSDSRYVFTFFLRVCQRFLLHDGVMRPTLSCLSCR